MMNLARRKILLMPLLALLFGCASSSIEVSSSSSESSQPASSASSYEAPFTVTPIIDEFDFDALNELAYSFDAGVYETISHLEGHNIASGDYLISAENISILPAYLVTLAPGSYNVTLVTTSGNVAIPFEVLDRHNQHRIVNQGFEMGNLFGWTSGTLFKGEANLQSFTDSSVTLNTTIPGQSVTYDGVGSYLLARPTALSLSLFEERMGRLSSMPFTLGGNGYVSFRLGAGKTGDLSYISFRDADTDYEIARYGNHLFPLTGSENLNAYQADLSAHIGKRMYVEIYDYGGHGYDFITADDFETYHDSIPSGMETAIDIKPTYDIGYAPNQVTNGSFDQGMDGWTPSTQVGWQKTDGSYDTFTISAGSLRTNASGDTARGLVRSSLFRVDGSGIVSIQLAAAQGARFDKDTYVSIRLENTNREIIRFTNSRHNGNEFLTYHIDLSAYMNARCYFEIVDNAVGSWDTIFIDNVVTYYGIRPSFTFMTMAVNLNY